MTVSKHPQYTVRRVLGQAQFGDVLLCRKASDDNQAESLVVVKQVNVRELRLRRRRGGERPCDDPIRECEVAAKIQAVGAHKNVVKYLDSFKMDASTIGIAMEYCNDGDLLQHLEEMPDHRLPEREALEAFRQIVDGLQFLHTKVGVAHRDVSLENVLVHDGVCKISDFGLCAPANQVSMDRVGKLGYMAPEVVAEMAYDPKQADVWSLGILFFVLLTGSPLVDIASADCDRFLAFCRFGVRRILVEWGIAAELHEETIDLCERLLQINPSDRISLAAVQQHSAFNSEI